MDLMYHSPPLLSSTMMEVNGEAPIPTSVPSDVVLPRWLRVGSSQEACCWCERLGAVPLLCLEEWGWGSHPAVKESALHSWGWTAHLSAPSQLQRARCKHSGYSSSRILQWNKTGTFQTPKPRKPITWQQKKKSLIAHRRGRVNQPNF